MKIKLQKDKKSKRNIIIAILLLLLVIGSCGKNNRNSGDESGQDSGTSKITETSEETTTITEKTTETVTTEIITTEATTENTISVPDVRGMKFSDAKKQYEDFEFKVSKYLPVEEYPDFKPGDIISQEVEPNEKLKKGDTIFVAVCKGKITDDTSNTADETVECPDLLGKSFEEAVEMFGDIITIEKSGEDYHAYIAEGNIIEQDTEVFSDIKKSSVVKVKVSMGQPPATENVPPVETVPPEPVQPVEPVVSIIHFILNTESGCIHTDSGCSAAQKILPENYAEIDIPDNEISNYNNVYWACGKCSKKYSDILPKF